MPPPKLFVKYSIAQKIGVRGEKNEIVPTYKLCYYITMKKNVIVLISIVILTAIDQIFKLVAYENLRQESRSLIERNA